MKKNASPRRIIILLIVLLVVGGAAFRLISRHIPSNEKMDLYEYYGQTADYEAVLCIDSVMPEERALVSGDLKYLPLSVVNRYLNKRFYWEEENGRILYVTQDNLESFPAQAEAGQEVWKNGETVYLEISFILHFTDMDTYYYENPSRLAIQKQFKDLTVVTTQKNTDIRFRGGIKAPILMTAAPGETLFLMEELENWDQVYTANGYVGYVQKKDVTAPAQMTIPRDSGKETYPRLRLDTRVNLVWDYVSSYDSAGRLSDLPSDSGVNVISPTCFSMKDNEGNIENYATAAYVKEAHSKGLKVWGLLDNFSPEVSSQETLSKTATRQNLVHNVVYAALSAGMDGINVDLEGLREETAVHFLEFLRELALVCHQNGLTLSADNTVPADFSAEFDLGAQGEAADYVIIMCYDEHYDGSAEPGSVSSFPWVEQGIADTVAKTDPAGVVMALPFYTRLWRVKAESLTSEVLTLSQTQEYLKENHIEPYWDNNVLQNVGTLETEDASLRIWVEDNNSLAEKLKLVSQYNLAGAAFWRLGFEYQEVWPVINGMLNP